MQGARLSSMVFLIRVCGRPECDLLVDCRVSSTVPPLVLAVGTRPPVVDGNRQFSWVFS
jgi:hypothetical protein